MVNKDEYTDTTRCCARHDDRNASNYRVMVGEFDRFEPDADEQPFDVRQLVVHEKYVGRNTFWDSDIALLELDDRCPVTACSMPVCLPPASDDDDRVPFKCYATGWGRDIGMLRRNSVISRGMRPEREFGIPVSPAGMRMDTV